MGQADLADIYQRHRQGLFTLALSITRCSARAEDAVHDAFTRLCQAGRALPMDAVSYVFAAVRNAAIDQVRRSPESRDVPISIFNGEAGGPHQRAVDVERTQSVARAIEALPDEQRETVVLRVYAGLSFGQISGIVGAPLATVASRYRRALEQLRGRLESVYES